MRLRRLDISAGMGVAVAAWGLAACGGEDGRVTELRPPVTLELSAALTSRHELAVGPRSFGAGPVSITASNQAREPVVFAISGAGPEGKLSLLSGAVGTLELDLASGTHRLLAIDGDGKQAVTLDVGPRRESPQHRLDLP